MSKVRDISNLSNIIKTDANGNVTFVSGSTTLMSISSSGAVTSTGAIGGSNATTLATTGSNTFTGQQYVSNTVAPVNFTDTASLYTDGGLRVGKDAYVSGTLYLNDLTVYGTQSINYITSSQLDIADNIITVNTSTPQIRFGGIAVRDSGSAGTGLTGSLLWDSQNNHWIYTNPSGSSYSGGMLISGPRNTGSMGDEQGTTLNAIMKGMGGDHITSSGMFESGSNIGIGTSSPSYTLDVNGTGRFSGALTGTTADFETTIGTRYLQIRDAGTSTPSIRSVNNTIAQLRHIAIEANTISLRTGASSGLTVTEALAISATGAATFSGTVNVYDGSSHGLSISNSSGAITFTNNWSKTTFTVGSAQDIEFNDDGGVKRLFLKNGGNVGIGTVSPVSTNLAGSLTIVKSYSGDTPTSTTAQNYYNNQSNLYLFGRNAGLTMVGNTNEECIIAFASPSSDYLGAIRYETQSTSAGGAMKFQTGGANERMRITAGGEVVIGTTTSFNNEKLRVAGTISSGVSAMAITSAVETSVPNSTATTVWTCPDYPRVMYYMVFVRINSGANADTYSCYAVIAASNIAGAKLLTVVNSSGMSISVSSRDVRVTQSSGATQTVHTSVIQIFSNGGTI